MSLADAFERRLRTYDPSLRLRWGHAVQGWVVERKARMSKGERDLIHFASQHFGASVEDIEKERSAKLGHHMIGHAKVLDNKILDDLMLHDLQRKGSGAASQVDRVLKQREKTLEEGRKQSHETARQTNDVLHWALKKQTAKIDAGRSDELIAEGFGWKVQKGQVFGPPTAPKKVALLDSFGKPL